MGAKDSVIALLPKLTVAERQEVRGALQELGRADLTSTTLTKSTVSDDWVLVGLATYLIQRGMLPARNGIYELTRRDAYKQYLSKLPGLMGFLADLEKNNKLTNRHRLTLSFLCARELGRMLETRNYFSVGAMLAHIDKIPEALDQAYPGYVAANLFGFILKQAEGIKP